MNQIFAVGVNFLSNNAYAVYFAAGAIVLGASLLYARWFLPPVDALAEDLRKVADALSAGPGNFQDARARVRGVLDPSSVDSPSLHAVWVETEGRVVSLTRRDAQVESVMFGAPRDLWSANRLLARQINLPLAEAIPNLLVGLGLLLTFFFLTLALTQATAALLPQSGQAPADITSATRGLLSAAGAKFLTSLAGLLASIFWTVAAKRKMAELTDASEQVLDHLANVVRFAGGEEMLREHLHWTQQTAYEARVIVGATREVAQHVEGVEDSARTQVRLTEQLVSETQQVASRVGAVGDAAANQVSLAEELLSEAREQTGTFKRFETDLAVSLAGAITQAFSPQMEAMTNRLTDAIEGLSAKIGSMNQDALKKMLEDFQNMLTSASNSEMTQLKVALETLTERLVAAGTAIEQGGGEVAGSLADAGTKLLSTVEQISVHLATGATNLEGATQGLKEAMNDLDTTIVNAADLGSQGAAFVRNALDTAGPLFDRLDGATKELNVAGSALERMSGQLAGAVDGVEDMTKEQRAVVTAVRAATPQALESIQRVVDLLQQTVIATATSMDQTRSAMDDTSKTLNDTVAGITTGVNDYSRTLGDLHRTLDAALAGAVGSLNNSISNLEEVLEEFVDSLAAARGGV